MKFDFVNKIKNDSSIWYFQGHAKTVGTLIKEFGAEVDALDNNGWTPILCGAYMGNFWEFKI